MPLISEKLKLMSCSEFRVFLKNTLIFIKNTLILIKNTCYSIKKYFSF